MYIWVALATFLALLYSFNLSVRGDERKLEVEPLAEAAVSSFAIHHRAGQQYIYARTSHDDRPINYDKGIISYSSDLKDFFPVGFKINENYKTEIYCIPKIEKVDTQGDTYYEIDWNSTADNCRDPNVVRVLVTYGPVPERWVNYSSNTPTNDFLNALKNVMGVDSSIGYIEKSAKRADFSWEIKGCEDNPVYIPGAVAQTGGFSHQCTCANCPRCLAFMSIYE